MAYSTSQAAALAGCSAQTVRANIAAGLLPLTHDKQNRQWTRLGAIDVVRLAVLRTLQDHGLALHECVAAVTASVDRYLVLHVSTVRDWQDMLRVVTGVTLRVQRTPSGIVAALRFADAPWPDGEPPAAATLVLDLHVIAGLCRARLPKSFEES